MRTDVQTPDSLFSNQAAPQQIAFQWRNVIRMLLRCTQYVLFPVLLLVVVLILFTTFLILSNGVFGFGPRHHRESDRTVAMAVGQDGEAAKKETSSGSEEKKEGGKEEAKSETPAKDTLTEEVGIELRKQLGTPRRAYNFVKSAVFQNEYLRGSLAFDSDEIAHMSDQERKDLAYRFDFVLTRLADIHPEDLPDDTEKEEYSFQPNSNYPPFVLVKKGTYYQFDAETIRNIRELYSQLHEQPPALTGRNFLSNLPSWWFKTKLGLSYIQWAGVCFFFFAGYVVGWASSRLLYLLTLAPFQILRQDPGTFKISLKTWQPIGWLITYAVWYLGLLMIKAPPVAADMMGYPIRLLVILMCILTALRLTDIVGESIRIRVRQKYSKIDQILVPLFSRSMKILIVCWGIIMLFQLLGFSAVSIVSGMGIGGIAIALAAQNTIANFFGSLTVLMDRPFVIGDWIVTSGIEGEVESVGMRSTRVRTFYNSQITIPNNLLTTAIIDNMGRRHFRRYKTLVKVHYNTPPDTIDAFCAGIRELILSYPNTRKDLFHVYVHEMGDSSIDILLTCFFLVPDFASEAKARGALILDIMRLAQKMHVEFAYPTQTIYNIQATDQIIETDEPALTDVQACAIADEIVDTERAAQKLKEAAKAN